MIFSLQMLHVPVFMLFNLLFSLLHIFSLFNFYSHFSCPIVGADLYKEELGRKDLVYRVIKRSVKMITNFARIG